MRTYATRAALIPIRKSEAWWALAQDERRAIFEEQSKHIAIGMEYLPPVARRLHHCRELGEAFDFLTWFEYAPEHAKSISDSVGSSGLWRPVKVGGPTRVSGFVKDCSTPARVRNAARIRRGLTGRCWTILKGGNREGVRWRSVRAKSYGDLSARDAVSGDDGVRMLRAD